MTTLLLYVLIVAAVVAFIGLYFGLGWAYDLLMDRYQARRKHVLHTTAADERVVPRTGPPTAKQAAAAKAAREARYGELREIPEPGKDYISDQNVRLPWTPPACQGHCLPSHHCEVCHGPLGYEEPPVVADITDVGRKPAAVPAPDVDADVAEWQHILAPAERLATDTDVRDVLPAWVIEALGGHDGVDAAVESIVARAEAS